MDSEKNEEKDRLWDYHVDILQKECIIHKARIENSFDRWKHKSEEGFLPPPENLGIFDELRKMNNKDAAILRYIRDKRLKRWETRSFEDIYTLTDRLSDLHLIQAVVERCYWQRMEGYEAASVDAIRRGAFSEVGTIEQICNSADFLCQTYWDRIFGEGKRDWHGIVNFGLFNEFRNWGPLIFAPDYAKLYNFKTWVYLAHEVTHGAVELLLNTKKLGAVFDDLVNIFSKVPPDLKIAENDYLAKETICDVVSTLVTGGAYIQTLATLKFYPTVTICSNSGFLQRPIQYPMILRVVISGWTMSIAWGLNKTVDCGRSESFPTRELIARVTSEDREELERIKRFLKTDKDWFKKRLPEWKSHKRVGKELENIWDYITLQYDILPSIVRSLLAKNLIPRIKSIISKDYYGTNPNQFFYRFDNNNQWQQQHMLHIEPVFCEETLDAPDIALKINERTRELSGIANMMAQGDLVTKADPIDIIACLSCLETKDQIAESKSQMENVAITSIGLQSRYSDRRFRVGQRRHSRATN
jgi:hypothetical protein